VDRYYDPGKPRGKHDFYHQAELDNRTTQNRTPPGYYAPGDSGTRRKPVARKQSSAKLSSLAARILAMSEIEMTNWLETRPHKDIRSLAGSVVSNDETKGQDGKKRSRPAIENKA
jgi:hypothetical protein